MRDSSKVTADLELVLDSRLESADLAESSLLQLSRDLGFSDDQQQDIGLAVREAVTNAVFHGNQGDEGRKVALRAVFRRPCLEVSVLDQGRGIDLASLPNPLNPAKLFHGSGRGIRLMQCLMDEVLIRNHAPGVEVVLIKRIPDEMKEEAQMALQIQTRQSEGVTILDLKGRIVLGEESSALRQTIKDLAERGERKVLLNLAEVNYIDSSGLGTLASGYLTISNGQGKLKLTKVSKRIRDMMAFTNLESVFEMFDEETAALESFR